MNKDTHKIFENIEVETILFDEPMKNHTTFQIGGNADVFFKPKTEEELKRVLQICKQNNVNIFVKGNGSNLLIREKGIRGVVIEFMENFNKIEVDGNFVIAQSGASLSEVSKFSFEQSLTGMEQVSGIPASVGGAMRMNAGAYGTEMKDIVDSVRVMDLSGEVYEFKNSEMKFGYRSSIVEEKNLIVLSAKFKLSKGNKEDILAAFRDYDYRRSSKQPLESPSAGSTFKRPEGYYASALIEEAGLKGFSNGAAQVSQKHSGFIINTGKATCEEVLGLIEKVQKIVYEKYSVNLETEVKIVGEE